MADNTKQTIIENGTELDGTLRSDCGVTLSGRMKGQLSAPALTVTATGSVQGQVRVANLKADGEISGDIEADSVTLAGRVNDQTVIRAKSLEVSLTQEKGAMQVTFGNCELQVGDAKARSQEKPKATAPAEVRKDAPTARHEAETTTVPRK